LPAIGYRGAASKVFPPKWTGGSAWFLNRNPERSHHDERQRAFHSIFPGCALLNGWRHCSQWPELLQRNNRLAREPVRNPFRTRPRQNNSPQRTLPRKEAGKFVGYMTKRSLFFPDIAASPPIRSQWEASSSSSSTKHFSGDHSDLCLWCGLRAVAGYAAWLWTRGRGLRQAIRRVHGNWRIE